MLGPLINSALVVVGGLFGGRLGGKIPRRLKEALPLSCGIVSLGIGAAMMNKVQAIPPVAMSILAGALIGELLHLERGLERAIGWCQRRVEHAWPNERGNPQVENFVVKYVTILVLFCASGMGVFGSMHEGMSGDPNILIAKGILDLFTSAIFAAELGYAVAFIAVPQIVIQGLFYYSATLLLPLVSPAMQGDFSACGGIIMLATGLRICGIKVFPIVNMLPALVLIMPCSALWTALFG